MPFFCSSASKHVPSLPPHAREGSRSFVGDHMPGNDSTDDLPDKDDHDTKGIGLDDDELGDRNL